MACNISHLNLLSTFLHPQRLLKAAQSLLPLLDWSLFGTATATVAATLFWLLGQSASLQHQKQSYRLQLCCPVATSVHAATTANEHFSKTATTLLIVAETLDLWWQISGERSLQVGRFTQSLNQTRFRFPLLEEGVRHLPRCQNNRNYSTPNDVRTRTTEHALLNWDPWPAWLKLPRPWFTFISDEVGVRAWMHAPTQHQWLLLWN